MAAKFCKDCQYCEVVTLGGHDFSKCRRPVGVDPVTGKVETPRLDYCCIQRSGDWFDVLFLGVCGARGRYFAEKSDA